MYDNDGAAIVHVIRILSKEERDGIREKKNFEKNNGWFEISNSFFSCDIISIKF